MSIFPLPVFEADADPTHRSAMTDQEIYDALEPPKTIVVRFGAMKLIGEYPYSGDAKPGCGSKLVVRTHRGTELAEMLTSTCENAGCSKSVTRQEMLDYIDNSGGKDYPFHTRGKVLRIASIDDLNGQSALESTRQEAVRECKRLINELRLPMSLVDAEPILGEELLTLYYMSEERVDFRELVKQLADIFTTRIEMRQVGARDEARLVADYERCGQHCCCKNFLKVLKPVSMGAAKRQKATLEPLKISGRCGRLMCCLRYEDQTYKELRAALPRRKSRVGTAEGPGIVVDTKVLVQLALVKLEHDGREIAVPVEELLDPDNCPPPGTIPETADDPLRGMGVDEVEGRANTRGRGKRGRKSKEDQQDAYRGKSQRSDTQPGDNSESGDGDRPRKRRRRRRKAGQSGDQPADAQGRAPAASPGEGRKSEDEKSGDGQGEGPKRKRRRRRRGGQGKPRGSDGAAGNQPSSQTSSGSSPDDGGKEAPDSSGGQKRKRRRRRGGRGRGKGGGGGGSGGQSGSGGDPSTGPPSESG